jgi:lysylphosphatidylglycerol synthetase-like protein (DUF2156 family)
LYVYKDGAMSSSTKETWGLIGAFTILIALILIFKEPAAEIIIYGTIIIGLAAGLLFGFAVMLIGFVVAVFVKRNFIDHMDPEGIHWKVEAFVGTIVAVVAQFVILSLLFFQSLPSSRFLNNDSNTFQVFSLCSILNVALVLGYYLLPRKIDKGNTPFPSSDTTKSQEGFFMPKKILPSEKSLHV